MNNDRGLLSGSITILIGAVIAIMALVRGPWQVWLLLGIFTLWGLWVVLILLLPYMQQAKRHTSVSSAPDNSMQKASKQEILKFLTWAAPAPMTCWFATPTIVFWHICAPLIRKPPSSGVKSSRSS